MSSSSRREPARGPFHAGQVREGDRYELSDGHAIYCAPTGADGARRAAIGAEVLETDPLVVEAGIDAGYTPSGAGSLRAPDIAVGNVPDRPGWVPGAPPLAVEYAGSGQDEADLTAKIGELLDAGTLWVWVVRLVGPRRVEVHEKGRPVRVLGSGDTLTAPGVLQNPVPVEALFDRERAHEAALRNLLQRRGFQSLDDVREAGKSEGREEGREEGRDAGLREAARRLYADGMSRDRIVALLGVDPVDSTG